MRDHVSGHRSHTGATHVLTTEVDARNQDAYRSPQSRIRQRIEDLAIEHAFLLRALHVDDRRLAGDLDRLFDPAHAHVGVNAGGEAAGQLDLVSLYGRETDEREPHGIDAGPEILNRVL